MQVLQGLRSIKNFFLSLALLCTLCSNYCLYSAVTIPVENRIANESPGYCVWASIETLCRHQGIRVGYGLKEARKRDEDYVLPSGEVIAKNFGREEPVADKLQKLGIKYKMVPSGTRSDVGISLIKEAIKDGRGAVVAVWHGRPTCEECHAVVVIDFNEVNYEYVDSNDPTSTYVGTRKFFDAEFTGYVLTLER